MDNIHTIMGVLCVLATITRKEFRMAIRLEETFWPISKDFCFIIQTDVEMMKREKEKLEEKLEIVEKKLSVVIKKLTSAEIASISQSLDCKLDD